MLYADPGSGVLIWQIWRALVFGVTCYFAQFRHWVSAKVRPERNDHSLKTAEETHVSKSLSEDE